MQEREVERKRLGFKEIGRDGTFVKYANGMIYDEKTNLEWYAGSDRNITWNEAKRWTESLNVDGGGWRMPTKKELKTLYKRWVRENNINSLFISLADVCGLVEQRVRKVGTSTIATASDTGQNATKTTPDLLQYAPKAMDNMLI